MNPLFFIAKRYFFTANDSNFVNIVSWVSLLGIVVGTAALILVLSVFNGFEDLVLKMYSSFNPHLKITSAEGKVFDPKKYSGFLNNPQFESSAYILEEKVLIRYKEKEFIATVKGVSDSYSSLTGFDSLLVDGEYINNYKNNNVAVVGSGVAYHLSIGIANIFDQLQIFSPNRNAKTLLNPNTAFRQGSVLPVGVFSIQSEIDQEYIITPLAFIQQLAERGDNISAIEIKLINENSMLVEKEKLAARMGDDFIVKSRFEQQEFLYRILNTEKLAVFLILTFIMIIATFNIIGSLSMLMLDKKKDISVLRSIGCTVQDIRSIFFRKSMLTILFGIVIGNFIGIGIAFLQKKIGIIGMGDGSFIIDNYPVAIVFDDIILVSFTVFTIGLIASWYPATVLSKRLFKI